MSGITSNHNLSIQTQNNIKQQNKSNDPIPKEVILPEDNKIDTKDSNLINSKINSTSLDVNPNLRFLSSDEPEPTLIDLKNVKLDSFEEGISLKDIKKGGMLEKAKNGELPIKGDSVKHLQILLNKTGFPVKVSKEFCKDTEKQLKAFQKMFSLNETGKLDNKSLKELENYSNSSQCRQELASSAALVKKKTSGHDCFGGVGRSADKAWGRDFGVQVFPYGENAKHAYKAADLLAKRSDFREVKVNASDLGKLPSGAIVVWGQTNVSPSGHISIAVGNGQESSDFKGTQMTNLRGYSNCRVFLPMIKNK